MRCRISKRTGWRKASTFLLMEYFLRTRSIFCGEGYELREDEIFCGHAAIRSLASVESFEPRFRGALIVSGRVSRVGVKRFSPYAALRPRPFVGKLALNAKWCSYSPAIRRSSLAQWEWVLGLPLWHLNFITLSCWSLNIVPSSNEFICSLGPRAQRAVFDSCFQTGTRLIFYSNSHQSGSRPRKC